MPRNLQGAGTLQMADIVSQQKRSEMMSGIKGKDRKPEQFIRKALHRQGYRYRLHVKDLPGKPDLVFPRYKAVIFVQGCFWHGHDCHLFKWPQSRIEFWHNKITKNQANDQKAINALELAGWRVLCLWECAIKGKECLSPDHILDLVTDWLHSEVLNLEIRGNGNGGQARLSRDRRSEPA